MMYPATVVCRFPGLAFSLVPLMSVAILRLSEETPPELTAPSSKSRKVKKKLHVSVEGE